MGIMVLSGPKKMELQKWWVAMWVLGIEPNSSRRASNERPVSALNRKAFSPSLWVKLLWVWFFTMSYYMLYYLDMLCISLWCCSSNFFALTFMLSVYNFYNHESSIYLPPFCLSQFWWLLQYNRNCIVYKQQKPFFLSAYIRIWKV